MSAEEGLIFEGEGDPGTHLVADCRKYNGDVKVVQTPRWHQAVQQLVFKETMRLMLEQHPTEHIDIRQIMLKKVAGEGACIYPRLCLAKVKSETLIDEGSFGKVFKGSFGGMDIAIKQMKANCSLESFLRERDLLVYLKHDKIVNLIGSFHDNGTYFLFELCFANLRRAAESIPARLKVKFGYQLLEGINWMHSKNVIHCDIRPENVFINLKSNIVIGDFGCAQRLPQGYGFVTSGKLVSVPSYSDPLAIERNVYGKSSDIFGAACTLFEMDLVNRFLLRYGADTTGNILPSEYCLAFRKGRIVGFTGFEHLEGFGSPTLQREKLHDRAMKSKLFGDLIRLMVSNTNVRLNAAEALAHGCWSLWFKNYSITQEKLIEDVERYKGNHPNNSNESLRPVRIRSVSNIYMQIVYYDEKDNVGDLTGLESRMPVLNQPVSQSDAIAAGPSTECGRVNPDIDVGNVLQNFVNTIWKDMSPEGMTGIMCFPFGAVNSAEMHPVSGVVIPMEFAGSRSAITESVGGRLADDETISQDQSSSTDPEAASSSKSIVSTGRKISKSKGKQVLEPEEKTAASTKEEQKSCTKKSNRSEGISKTKPTYMNIPPPGVHAAVSFEDSIPSQPPPPIFIPPEPLSQTKQPSPPLKKKHTKSHAAPTLLESSKSSSNPASSNVTTTTTTAAKRKYNSKESVEAAMNKHQKVSEKAKAAPTTTFRSEASSKEKKPQKKKKRSTIYFCQDCFFENDSEEVMELHRDTCKKRLQRKKLEKEKQ